MPSFYIQKWRTNYIRTVNIIRIYERFICILRLDLAVLNTGTLQGADPDIIRAHMWKCQISHVLLLLIGMLKFSRTEYGINKTQ